MSGVVFLLTGSGSMPAAGGDKTRPIVGQEARLYGAFIVALGLYFVYVLRKSRGSKK